MGLLIFIAFVALVVYLIKSNNKKKVANKKKEFDDQYRLGQSNPHAEKYYAVIDVETTGLIKDRDLKPTKSNLDNFPRIIEIAWAIFSVKGELISEASYLIKQSSPIPQKAIEIHGITDTDCEKDGCELSEILQKLSDEITGGCKIVGHNIMFDKRVIESEFVRLGMPLPFKGMTKYDTLQMARQHYKIGGYPKLGDVYQKLTGKDPKIEFTQHRSLDDVAMTANIFFNLKWFGNVYQGNKKTA